VITGSAEESVKRNAKVIAGSAEGVGDLSNLINAAKPRPQ